MNRGRNYMDKLLGRNEGRESREESYNEDQFSDSGSEWNRSSEFRGPEERERFNNGRGQRSQTARSAPRQSYYKSDSERDFNTRFNTRPEADRGNSSFTPGDFRNAGSTRGGFFGKGPKGYKRSDERIREEVCDTLFRDYHVDASEIEVEVKDGIVTLNGSVDSRSTKRSAEEAIEHLAGVTDVHNRIRIAEKGNVSNLRTGTDSGEKRALS